jgi:HAD superfamily hydrolase (TIGR01509 family)
MTITSKTIEAVIFDWDATLADTRAVIVTSFQQALKKVNINNIPNSYIERRMGIGAAETFREILLQKTNQPADELIIKRLVEDKSQIQIDLKSHVKLFSGAIDLLEKLQGKVKMGLASMNSKSVIDALIHAKNLEEYFQTVVTGDIIKQSKPHPDIFFKCAQQLNTIPSKCIVIEDSLFGVKAAKAAGMRCIAVTTGVYSKEELEPLEPDIIVTNLEQAKFYLLNQYFLYRQ